MAADRFVLIRGFGDHTLVSEFQARQYGRMPTAAVVACRSAVPAGSAAATAGGGVGSTGSGSISRFFCK